MIRPAQTTQTVKPGRMEGRLLPGLVRLGDYCWLHTFAQDFFHGHDVGADPTQLRFFAITIPSPIIIGDGVIGMFAL
jgi:hypothetical protein